MDKTLLKKAAMQSIALMLAVITLSYALKYYDAITIAASSLLGSGAAEEDIRQTAQGQASQESKPADLLDVNQETPVNDTEEYDNTPITDVTSLKARIDESILQQLGENFLVIKKPEGSGLKMNLYDLYINHSIQLDITGTFMNNMIPDMVYRVRGEELFNDTPEFTEIITKVVDEDKGTTEEVITKDYGNDLCYNITITSQKEMNGNVLNQLLLELDTVYAHIIYEDAYYYYIDLRKPSEVYDKIVVIDAGHGGKDVGAISKNDDYYEKNINLGIALWLKALLDQEEIKVYYTRTEDTTVFLRPRVTLANAVDCDYFISIHCNSNEITSPNGTEVLYYDNEFKGVKSYDLANLAAEELAKTITLKQKGTVLKHMEDIFIMDNAQVPMVLIEVGYLSNNGDLNYLINPDNQKSVAQGIYQAVIRAFQELPTTN